MADLPGRPAYDPADREYGDADRRAVDRRGDAVTEPDGSSHQSDPGWGSPVPAEYGSLRAMRPPPDPGERARPADGRRSSAATRGRAGRAKAADRSSMTAMLRRLQGIDDPATAPSTDGATPQPPVDGSRSALDTAPAPELLATPADAIPGPVREQEAALGAAIDGAALTGWGPAATQEAEEPGAPIRLSRRDRKAQLRASQVRTRATIRHVDVLTVLRVSVIFYLIVLLVVVIASVLLWYAADAFGTLPSFEKSIRTLFSLKSFNVHPAAVAMYVSAAGAVIAVAGTLANVLLALIYNLICDVVGGVRVQVDSYPSE